MSVLIYAETEGGKVKKVAFEVASYGKAVADQMGCEVVAVAFNASDADVLGNYGISEVMNITHEGNFDAKIYASGIQQAAEQTAAKVVVVSSSADSRYLTPLVAVGLSCSSRPVVNRLTTTGVWFLAPTSPSLLGRLSKAPRLIKPPNFPCA